MLGKPGTMKPLLAMNMAGPCNAVLLCIEWMKAISSTCVASLGKRSLTQRPHSPCCRNFQKLGVQLPGFEAKNWTFPVGSKGVPARFSSSGL